MKYFPAKTGGRIFVIGFQAGDFVLESINEIIKLENIQSGVVISGIGTLDFCVLHMVMTTGYPPVEYFKKWSDCPLELCSIDGIIVDGKAHLHCVVSDNEKAYAGHLEEGCRILYLGEVVIMEADDLHLVRMPNEKGISLLSATKDPAE